ncbi:bifunctional 3,4-dihydroxy-2-butanone-4-phosphate synthase/GTP cyclohydrolase II [Rhodococcus ruber]|uniref:Riboflavin biosynthesis protein RibBA n=1 Tax=Rhodococcus ruber TaxID=1830 RepID=A0ABT4MES2_9NOCA|nr:bifunctional 3,4-dihydroxy-2-butanone-4-phosphate synthase/GTP cyclohydrolase II [Rhodococcus ruber]MCZ4519487.1 bifunctional 3,4-dihydroxy-2-butanone-4-phosphate synthase/GTP cyclohydrolase II [Rhodococcus ruber]
MFDNATTDAHTSEDQQRSDAPEIADARVERALSELRLGRMVLVVDDEDREDEGDLIVPAQFASPRAVAFMIRHTSGILCAAMTEQRADELHLPLMTDNSDDPRGTAFTISVDLKGVTTTGVSAADRAATARALTDPATRAEDLSRPGHVFPLRARAGGVLQRAGHTESAVDLCTLADLEPVALIGEITNDEGEMARRPELRQFASEHGLTMLSVADLVRYRRARASVVERIASGRVPTDAGQFTAACFRSVIDGCEHVAFVLGDVAGATEPVLTRVHSECLTGDVFGSRRCDCGEQLDAAMRLIGQAGCGVVVYLRGHEGRGIGLAHKLRAYQLQDAGMDTLQANEAQGLPVDSREYGVGAEILRSLDVRKIRLMTNNPAKFRGLSGHGIEIVNRLPLVVQPNPENQKYLDTKRIRLQHALSPERAS